MINGEQLGGDRLSSVEQLRPPHVVAILDAGAQYGLDIEQKLKRQGYLAERLPFETPLEDLLAYKAIILSGGPESVYDPEAPKCDPRIFEDNPDRPPVLGICYGAQLMNYSLGGKVEALDTREDGFMDISVNPGMTIFDGLDPHQEVLMSHGDTVTDLAPGFKAAAFSGELVAAIANPAQRLYGLQFHPEVSTVNGPEMLGKFLKDVAGMEKDYLHSTREFIKDAIQEIQREVGKRQVLAFISGGVDSAGLGAILEEALPSDQVFLVYVNNGFMRANESEHVADSLGRAGIKVHVFDATDMFISGTTIIDGVETPPLYEVIDPEVKRKISGDTFIKVQDRMAEELGLELDNFMLAMGTLHTDLIESGSKHASQKADTIKSHHNDTAAVRKLRDAGRVIEPWKNLQKDDVRAVAKELGLPDEIVNRQPFPGPGLAIRIICGDRVAYDDQSLAVIEKLSFMNTDNFKTSLLPIKTVGVQGDHRTYGHLVGLSGERDWNNLVSLAKTIPTQVHGVNRVVYIFGDYPGITSDITPTRLTPDVIEELRQVDAVVNKTLKKYGLDTSISQVPVISFPVNFGEDGKRSIGIRTIMTSNFKTGNIAIPGVDFPEEILLEIVDQIMEFPNIARVVYDLTSKPPATTEWE